MNLSKKLLFMALASCAALPAVAKDAQVGTGETNGYRLVWQDLFDDSELRPDRWNIEVNGSGGGNNELQFYTDLDKPNKMDEKPFLEIDLLDIDEHVVPELAKLTKVLLDGYRQKVKVAR